MPDTTTADPVHSDRLVGLAEVAELLQTSRQTVANWRSRRGNFPAPVADLKSGPIWRRAEILEWAAANELAVAETDTTDLDSTPRTAPSTVALMNMKGGVGKSTLTANLGWYCAYKRNQRVLLVDLDPQFNLSQYVMGTARYEKHLEDRKGTILDVFEQATPPSVSRKKPKVVTAANTISRVHAWTDGSHIDLVPSSLDLAWTLKNPNDKDHLLAYFLDEVQEQYDTILIDCAPTESMLTTAAYLAADSILIPVKPEFLSTIGLPLLVRSLTDFKRLHRKSIEVLGIVFNASADKLEHDRSRGFVRKVAADNGWDVFDNEIAYSDSYPKGSRFGKPIFLTDYARAHKVSNFICVADEFMRKLEA
jgi:chromosome partitioning protein